MLRKIRIFILFTIVTALLLSCGSESAEENLTVPAKKPHSIVADNMVREDFPSETATHRVSISMSFVGDCMLASNLGSMGQGGFNHLADSVEPDYFLENYSDIFQNDDWTVANLENCFTDSDLTPRNKGYTPAYWYRSKAENAGILTAGGIEVVSLANNHAEDYGSRGYADTKEALEAKGILWGDNDNTVILEKEGYRIALLCTTFYYRGFEKTIAKRLSQTDADYKIVFLHGGTERVHTPDEWKAEGCRYLIDNGADIVIGHHPHVLQPIEIYNGKTIVHSLGNFVFGGSLREENRTMVYCLDLEIENQRLVKENGSVIPCYLYSDLFKPAIITDTEEIEAVNRFLNGESDSPIAARK